MKVKAIKTHKIKRNDNLYEVFDRYLKDLPEGSIVAVTSKIVSICEGRVVPVERSNKDKLVEQEADYYLPKESSKYDLYLTIKNNRLAVSAGIDESNSDGNYVLWPEDPQKSANEIRKFLKEKFRLKKIGVIITDSITTPLRFGVTGIAIAYSGFDALNNLIGKPDVFGRRLKMTKVSIVDGLAASSVVVMGEGGEQTPLAVISDVPFVKFRDRNPTYSELAESKIAIEDDVYAPILKNAKWKKGK